MCDVSIALQRRHIEQVMHRTTEEKARGIGWTLFSALEDLDFAAVLALVSCSHQHMQRITDTEEFTYLGTTVTSDGGAHNDFRNRIN